MNRQKMTLSRFELWFFRELSDEQRAELFKLAQLPAEELGRSHARQLTAIRFILRELDTCAPS